MCERLGHAVIRPVQSAFRMRDCDAAVAGMVVITGIVREVMARSGVQPPRCFAGLPVNVDLRLASPLTHFLLSPQAKLRRLKSPNIGLPRPTGGRMLFTHSG